MLRDVYIGWLRVMKLFGGVATSDAVNVYLHVFVNGIIYAPRLVGHCVCVVAGLLHTVVRCWIRMVLQFCSYGIMQR